MGITGLSPYISYIFKTLKIHEAWSKNRFLTFHGKNKISSGSSGAIICHHPRRRFHAWLPAGTTSSLGMRGQAVNFGRTTAFGWPCIYPWYPSQFSSGIARNLGKSRIFGPKLHLVGPSFQRSAHGSPWSHAVGPDAQSAARPAAATV